MKFSNGFEFHPSEGRMFEILHEKRNKYIGIETQTPWTLAEYTDIDTYHSYVISYSIALSEFTKERPNVLEIGCQAGGGLLFWKELLQPKILCGIDIELAIPDHIATALYGGLKFQQFHMLIDDAYDANIIDRVMRIFPDGIDVLSEDGDHWVGNQIKTVELYYPLMNSGGVIMIEYIKMFKDRDMNHFHHGGNYKHGMDGLYVLEEFLKCGNYNYQIFDLRSNKGSPDDIMVAIHVD